MFMMFETYKVFLTSWMTKAFSDLGFLCLKFDGLCHSVSVNSEIGPWLKRGVCTWRAPQLHGWSSSEAAHLYPAVSAAPDTWKQEWHLTCKEALMILDVLKGL